MQRTCCSLYTRAARWAAAAYDCMPMCIGSFSFTRSRLASLARFLFVGQSDVRLRSLLQGTRVTYVTETFPEIWEQVLLSGRAMSCPPQALLSKKSEMRWQRGRLHSQGPRPFWWAMAGYTQCRRRAIGSILKHCTNQWTSSFTAWLKRLQLKSKQGVFPMQRLWHSTRSHISGNRGYHSNRVCFLLAAGLIRVCKILFFLFEGVLQ